MLNIGGPEILVILVVALLVLGPEKLPRVMRTVGKAVGELRRAGTEFQRTLNVDVSLDGDARTPTTSGTAAPDNGIAAPHAAASPPENSLPAAPPVKRKAAPRPLLARRTRGRSGGGNTDRP